MTSLSQMITSEQYADFMVPNYKLTNQEFSDHFSFAGGQVINDDYGILHLRLNSENLLNQAPYSSIPKVYALLNTNSLDTSGIQRIQSSKSLSLTGKGVLIGFIDTGINYMHPAFRKEDGTTRILKIWDQTIPSCQKKHAPFSYGSVYDQKVLLPPVSILPVPIYIRDTLKKQEPVLPRQ